MCYAEVLLYWRADVLCRGITLLEGWCVMQRYYFTGGLVCYAEVLLYWRADVLCRGITLLEGWCVMQRYYFTAFICQSLCKEK